MTDGMRSSKVSKEREALAVVVGQEPCPEGLGSLARSARESSGAVHSETPATTASSVSLNFHRCRVG